MKRLGIIESMDSSINRHAFYPKPHTRISTGKINQPNRTYVASSHRAETPGSSPASTSLLARGLISPSSSPPPPTTTSTLSPFPSSSESQILLKNTDSTHPTPNHGTNDTKHHLTPSRNASLTTLCTTLGNPSRLVTDERLPLSSRDASAPNSAGVSVLVRYCSCDAMYAFTLALRIVKHCARPTVPPNARN